MNKLTYWLRKSGMLRTSSYTVKGDADKLNEKIADDDGMVQSQEDIDMQYKASQSQQDNLEHTDNPTSQNKKESNSKALFWIFLSSGILIFLFMIVMDAFLAGFIFLALWMWFLHSIWKKAGQGILLIGQTIAVGIAFLTVALIFVIITMPTDEPVQENNNNIVEIKEKAKEENKITKVSIEENVSQDKISQFFAELKKDVKIEFDGISNDTNVVWTNGGAGLGLQKAKQITIKDTSNKTWQSIQKYFESNGGTHGTIGMVFVGNDNQTGYYFTDGEYKMLMCVMTQKKSEITMSCGWGPGGGK